MKDKKNIDRLFQEKFKNFEMHPSEKVWERISESQKVAKYTKINPSWLKLGGIAASLIILFTIGSVLLLNNEQVVNSKIVNQDIIQDENNKHLETLSPANNNNKNGIQKNTINVAETNSSSETKREENPTEKNNFNNITSENTIANTSKRSNQ